MKAGFPVACFRVAVVASVLGLAPTHRVSAGPPPGPIRTFPGTQEAWVRAGWIAPFVYHSSCLVQGHSETSVRWYDARGLVVKEVSGPRVTIGNGSVWERLGNGEIVHGLSPAWQLGLPDKPNPANLPGNLNNLRANGNFCVHQYHAQSGQTVVDVYANGQFAGSAGPFFDHPFGEIQFGENGYTTLVTWKDSEKKVSQVVVIGPDAKVCLRQDCEEEAIFPIPVANGRGVIFEMNGQNPPAQFTYIGADGTHVLFDPQVGRYLRATDPASDLVLCIRERQDVERFQLVRAATGQIVWEIPPPVRQYPNAMTQAMIAGGKVFLLGQDVAVLDLPSGKMLGLWKKERQDPVFGQFYRSGDEVYIFTNEEFFKLNPADIEAKRNGWQ